MAERGGLENRYTGNCIQGSNPCLSAEIKILRKLFQMFGTAFLFSPPSVISISWAQRILGPAEIPGW